MPISSILAGKTLCELSNWTFTNLQTQKVLYFAHMYHLGNEKKDPLIDEDFQAWIYGPVEPKLYRRVKIFGKYPIKKYVFWGSGEIDKKFSQYKWLKTIYEATKEISSENLIASTHWEKGAWNKKFVRGQSIIIPNDLIWDEYCARTQHSNQ